jgi:hypothetical protein
MADRPESKRQCRFCEHFDTEYDIELIFFSCSRNCFPRAEDKEGYPPELAATCPDFKLNDRQGSRWSNLPQDYKDSLRDVEARKTSQ